MRFLLTDEQREFARALDGMLGAAGTPAVGTRLGGRGPRCRP